MSGETESRALGSVRTPIRTFDQYLHPDPDRESLEGKVGSPFSSSGPPSFRSTSRPRGKTGVEGREKVVVTRLHHVSKVTEEENPSRLRTPTLIDYYVDKK